MKTLILNFLLSLAVAAIFLATPATGEADKMTHSFFNEKELDKFISDWPAFDAWNSEQDWRLSEIKNKGYGWFSGGFTIMNDDIILWEGMKDLPKVKAFLSTLGWDSDRFFYIIEQVLKGRTQIKVNKEVPKRAAQVQRDLERQMNNPDLPPVAREAMRNAMESTTRTIKEVKVDLDIPKSELELIKARREMLDTVMWKMD